MQVLLSIHEGFFEDELTPDFAEKERDLIVQVYGLRKADKVEAINIGPGADLIVLLTTFFNVAWSLFQGPGVLKKSIEGWEWLIEKLKGLVRKDLLVSLDQDAAGMLAIDFLVSKYGDNEDFDLLNSHTIPIVDLTGMVRNNTGGLATYPHNYYVFTFRIAGRIIILGVRSSGKIKELEIFQDMPYGLYDYNIDNLD